MFHVSQLKKKVSKKSVPIQTLPYADNSGQIRLEPLAVLDRMIIKCHNRPVAQMLIQWTNSALKDAS